MAADRLAIGAFSRASSISVRALRNYHDSGLLVPASVDSVTGSRSYTVDQLADVLIIVRLRDVDVPFAAVHRILGKHRRRCTGVAGLGRPRWSVATIRSV